MHLYMLCPGILQASQPFLRAILSSQAFEICRKRIYKCKILQKPGHMRCMRCERLNLSCTFVLPSKTRGPKRHPSVELQPQRQHVPTVAYRTNSICDRGFFKSIMQDYLKYLYPMVPVVYRPSFRKALLEDQDLEDDSLHSRFPLQRWSLQQCLAGLRLPDWDLVFEFYFPQRVCSFLLHQMRGNENIFLLR